MEDSVIKKWLEDAPGYSCSYRIESGYGNDSGSGYGSGHIAGSGRIEGGGTGFSFITGDSNGSDAGKGLGDGYGVGVGEIFGYGCGDGFPVGIKNVNCYTIFTIDNLRTIITQIKGNIAKGYILNQDLTMQPCYIAKGKGYYAHGKSIKEARESLTEKYLEDMGTEEIIDKFLSKFDKDKKYKGGLFFRWHHYLTGSCLMGRENFVKNRNIDLDSEFSVEEFIELCENEYGSSVIKQLKEEWRKKIKKEGKSMYNIIYNDIEFIKKQLSDMGAFVPGNKINGAITAHIFAKHITMTLEEIGKGDSYKISENNVYVLGCDCEFDYLLLKKDAERVYDFPIYKLEDVVAVIESKTTGVFSVKKDGEVGDLKKLVNSFNELYKKNPTLRLGYMTFSERIPVRETSINFWDETTRYLEKNIEGDWAAYATCLHTNSVDKPVVMGTDGEFLGYVKYICGLSENV